LLEALLGALLGEPVRLETADGTIEGLVEGDTKGVVVGVLGEVGLPFEADVGPMLGLALGTTVTLGAGEKVDGVGAGVSNATKPRKT
jgi:hypothetical protein